MRGVYFNLDVNFKVHSWHDWLISQIINVAREYKERWYKIRKKKTHTEEGKKGKLQLKLNTPSAPLDSDLHI